jgi:agmatinase
LNCVSAGELSWLPELITGQAVWLLLVRPWTIPVPSAPAPGAAPRPSGLLHRDWRNTAFTAGEICADLNFFDAGDLLLPPGNASRSLAIIETAVAGILGDKKFPLLLGGEHLVSLAALRAVAAAYPGLAVVHFDAHADLRSEYLGEEQSHAAVMYHVYRELGVDLYQFGIRSASPEEVGFAKQHTQFYPFHVLEPLRDCIPKLQGRPVYVSIDIDVVDPAFAPGTGTPEPGGITSAELLATVPLLAELDVVAMDLVEVAPIYDLAGITAMLAAKVVREAVIAFA